MMSIVRAIGRWIGPVLMLALIGVFFLGLNGPHPARVGVWMGFQALLPLLGAIVLVATLVRAGLTRRVFTPSLLAGFVLGLAGIAFIGIGLLRYPAAVETTTPAATVRVPMDGPVLVGWGGDTVKANYHAAYPDQRWAYDLVVEPAFTGSDRLEDYGCFGVPVLAPADGVVVRAHDGEPDQPPGEATASDPISGNSVAIRLPETGTHIEIAHLKRGSVAVAAGDAVTAGQVIGACGNSGNTSEPHVHIHHQREAPGEVPEGFAEGLPLYFESPDGPIMPEGGFDEDGTPTGAVISHKG